MKYDRNIFETHNEMVALGEIFESAPHKQTTITLDKYGLDISMGARPLIKIFYRNWNMPNPVCVEVYL